MIVPPRPTQQSGTRLWSQTQSQRCGVVLALRLVLRTQPRSGGAVKMGYTENFTDA